MPAPSVSARWAAAPASLAVLASVAAMGPG
jgi:hypothetical protein